MRSNEPLRLVYTWVLAVGSEPVAADNFWKKGSQQLWFRLSSDKLVALVEPVANFPLRSLWKPLSGVNPPTLYLEVFQKKSDFQKNTRVCHHYYSKV